MTNYFSLDSLSSRESSVAQLIACLALNGKDSDLYQTSVKALGLDAGSLSKIEAAFDETEKALADSDVKLSDLLANASKSTCCAK